MVERILETSEFIPTQFPLSGIHSRPGPSPQHVKVGAERVRHSERRGLMGRLGRVIENSYIGVWSGQVAPDFDREKMSSAITDVIGRLSPIRRKTFRYVSEVEPFYQALTAPAEVPFLGNERTTPTLKSLEYIFREVDRVYGARTLSKFQEIGEFNGKIDPKIRYLVEAALILAKTAVEPKPPFLGNPHLLPNQIIRDKNGKAVTQFDAICMPGLENTQTSSWGAIEIKARFRARETTGQRKMKKVMPRHIAALQDQLGRVVIAKEDERFTLPRFVVFAYLRGTLPNVYYLQRLDSGFVQKWRGVLGEKLENGFYKEGDDAGAQVVTAFLEKEEERLLAREKKAQKKYKKGKASRVEYEQGGLF